MLPDFSVCSPVQENTFNANYAVYYYGSVNGNGQDLPATYDKAIITTRATRGASGGLKNGSLYLISENDKFNDLTVNTSGWW
ncbi:Uncharacterised protein [Enterobacter hormaechei]|nr:Uncharacterised protein [Enterobacter hormaechei]